LRLPAFVDGAGTVPAPLHPETSLREHARRTHPGFYLSGPKIGQPFTPHPVRIIGIPPAAAPVDREAQLAARDAEIAQLRATLAEREKQS
jgi:hypothetical protein